MRPLAPAILAATLLFAGFGCKPILDAHVKQQQEAETLKSESMWVLQDPELTFAMEPDGTGKAYLDFRTQEGSSVTTTLTGPGVITNETQTVPAGDQGLVHAEWRINRRGRYDFTGQIVFNGVVVEQVDGYGDAY